MPLPEPARHTRARNRAERLDPVRWRGPNRGALLRLIAVAVLLVTSAAVLWSRPAACTPAPSAAPSHRSPPETPAGSSAIPAGSVGVPVRLADPTALAVVHPGNRVDLLRLDDAGGTTPVASAALVLDVTGADDPAVGGLLLALAPDEAEQAVAPAGRGFAVLIRSG